MIIDTMDMLFITRLFVAGSLGALIGLEREYRAKEAGLRTHFLVGIGSALIMLVSQYGFSDFIAGVENSGEVIRADPARIAAQIVSGIGFIGAGAIMVQRHTVSGLTTAAALWVVAGIGMAAGCGQYLLACTTTFFTLLALELFRFIGRLIDCQTASAVFSANNPDALSKLLKRIRGNGYSILNYRVEAIGEDSDALRVSILIRDRMPRRMRHCEDPLINLFRSDGEVHLLSLE